MAGLGKACSPIAALLFADKTTHSLKVSFPPHHFPIPGYHHQFDQCHLQNLHTLILQPQLRNRNDYWRMMKLAPLLVVMDYHHAAKKKVLVVSKLSEDDEDAVL